MTDNMSRQMSAWGWGAALASAVAVLPAVAARTGGGWIAPVLALPGLLLVERLLKPVRGRGLAQGLCGAFGRRFGCLLTIIYIMWGAVLGGLQLWVCARRMERALEPGWPGWAMAAGMVLLALWLVRGKAAACARWAMLALNGLLVVLGGVALLALMQVRRDNLLPLWGDGGTLANGAGVAIGLLCVFVYSAFVPRGGGRDGVRYPVLACGLLSFLLLDVQGSLGAELASRLEDPLLTLSRNVGSGGTLRRVESVLAASLMLGDLILLSLLMGASKPAAEQISRRRGGGWGPWAVGAGALGIALLPVQQLHVRRFCQQVVPGVNAVLGVLVPIALLMRGKTEGKIGAYLVPENKETGTY